MDLSSTLSGSKEFRIVKRGYDPEEVDTFLDQISLGVSELKRKLAEAADRAEGDPTAAAGAAGDTPETGAGEVHRVLILAQRAADEEVRKATEEGERLVTDARAQADDLLANAEQRAAGLRTEVDREVAQRRDEGRAGLLSEIHELEGVRGSLSNDVVVLERHVEEQREVVQAAIGELQSLLDHPEAFRIAMASGVSTVSAPPDEPIYVADVEAQETLGGGDDGPEGPGAEAVASDRGDADRGEAEQGTIRDELLATQAPGEGDEDDAGPADVAPPESVFARPDDPTPDAPQLTGPPDDDDAGPPTEAVATVADDDPDEDAFLAELRKAMLDDDPLGPRDESLAPSTIVDEDPNRNRPRFGRRR
ncbi:DivIVA domain-containing protein [Iamia sp.]|uniref:DivIVA domain-containing protein n=1 Tax=Iamia sp. TaxID=2722710 RepID=UPI002CA66191|nr:DivIVA domain-containing protein [Iamia sp.]HXH56440.1 DivIVA domain-containing protein [Iamia sp.]